jgi:outer membrane protein assembly factor BamC
MLVFVKSGKYHYVQFYFMVNFSGVLMISRVLYLSLLSLLVVSCSSVDKKKAEGDFDYATTPEAKPLLIPENLQQPKQNQTYVISNKINHTGPVGKAVDVRAPSLVLPVAAGSTVVTGSEEAIVWFDQSLDDSDLFEFILLSLQEQLMTDGVALNKIDPLTFESAWYHNEVESGWLFTSLERSESMRFKYEFVKKPHGRSVSLKVTIIDYMKSDNEGDDKQMNQIDKKRTEMAMVNDIIGQVDLNYQKEQRKIRLEMATKQMVSIGENIATEPAYIIELPIDYVWSNLPVFFEKHGFVITDLNENDNIYYVDFNQPGISVWDVIWGDSPPALDILDAKYQFVLSEKEKKTVLTIYNAGGDVIPVETLERVFPVMSEGLSFRDVY